MLLLSTVMHLAIIVTTTCQLRTGVAHDIVRPLSNVAEIPASGAHLGLYEVFFRQTKRKTEGPQHFAFPEISRENRGCLVLHSGNSRVSLNLRAGLGQNLRQN